MGLAVLSAVVDDGSGIGLLGFLLLAPTLWIVALRRGPWQLTERAPRFWMCVLGVIMVGIAGTHAVSHTVLAARGETMEVEVLAQDPADAVTWVLLAVAGVGLLAITVIGFGFPLGDRRYKQNVAQE